LTSAETLYNPSHSYFLPQRADPVSFCQSGCPWHQ